MYLRLLICILLISCQTQKKPSIEVTVKTDALNHGTYTDLEVTYSAKDETCEISWLAMRQVDKTQARHVSLQFRDYNQDCNKSFDQLKPLHHAILAKLFKDFTPSMIKGISTGGLSTLNRSQEWNEKIVRASLLMPEWQDYRKNYPHHKSKLSSNDMLVMLMKHEAPHLDFKQLFLEFGLNIDISSVEKVFTQSVGKVTAIRDAGSMYWVAL
jgi:hypothetical protein